MLKIQTFLYRTTSSVICFLSLHDALPISLRVPVSSRRPVRSSPASARPCSGSSVARRWRGTPPVRDRKSTRLNSSHSQISYAVFCLKKKKTFLYRKKTYFLSFNDFQRCVN